LVHSDFQIREARPEDDEQIGALLVEAFVTSYAREMPEVVVTEKRKKDLRDIVTKRQRACVLVAEDHGRLVGTVTLFPPGAETSEAWLPNAADLRHLAIDLRMRGQGVANALLDETERKAREWGCEGICLHVRRGAHGVARVYQKRGYRRSAAGDLDRLPEIFLEAYFLPLT
jgi:predicted N-acetyltransferase YhbS